jgi:quercetin dioxygenase-like cupin family protein
MNLLRTNMPDLRVFDTRTIPYSQDTRFPGISIKLLESRTTHPNASVIVARVDPGGTIPRHTHPTETETAYVLTGSGKLVTDDGETIFAVGVAVTIPPGLAHSVVNDGDSPLEIFAFHTPPTR